MHVAAGTWHFPVCCRGQICMPHSIRMLVFPDNNRFARSNHSTLLAILVCKQLTCEIRHRSATVLAKKIEEYLSFSPISFLHVAARGARLDANRKIEAILSRMADTLLLFCGSIDLMSSDSQHDFACFSKLYKHYKVLPDSRVSFFFVLGWHCSSLWQYIRALFFSLPNTQRREQLESNQICGEAKLAEKEMAFNCTQHLHMHICICRKRAAANSSTTWTIGRGPSCPSRLPVKSCLICFYVRQR
jgi:hypothetical protein